jgi:hypothetical protein
LHKRLKMCEQETREMSRKIGKLCISFVSLLTVNEQF